LAQDVTRIIVEEHHDGWFAYAVGVDGVVIGQRDTRAEAMQDAESALRFHCEVFGTASE